MSNPRKIRRNLSAEFKSKVAIAALREEMSLTELAHKYQLHPNQITQWKKQAIQNMQQLFVRKNKPGSRENENNEDKLHAKIGQLTVENDFLKKGLGL